MRQAIPVRVRIGGWASILLLGLSLAVPAAPAEPVTARTVVQQRQVFVGGPFLMQIRVEGSDSPEQPDLPPIPGVSVQPLGGSQNSSQSVTIVNGRVQTVVQKAYVFNYRLVAGREGAFTIPAATVRAEGKTVHTQPVSLRAVPPRESKDFKLRISLSPAKAYVGEPVVMTVTWYVGKNVNNFAFNVPALSDPRFEVFSPKVTPNPTRNVQISLGATQAIGEKGRGTLDGRDFLTVRFRKILIPKQAGQIRLPAATVAGQAVAGYQRRRSMMDEFFSDDIFGMGRQPITEEFVVPSNRPALDVLPLPATGRPANFSGLVGSFRIEGKASPTNVNVGDPITLTVLVSGPSFLDNVDLPRLSTQSVLARDFKIPSERASGEISGGVKRFTQTIRARHSGVAAIPPIELAYFNPRTARYEVARTRPIPLHVHATRVLTAKDAEGLGSTETPRSAIESSKGGIAYNYEGPDVLENQTYGPGAWLRSPVWLAGIALPPLLYLGLLGITLYGRWKEADPVARRSRQAFKRLSKALAALPPGDTDAYYAGLLEALRNYLGDKLQLHAAALTFTDVQPSLAGRGADAATLDSLRQLFDRLEAGRYAGASTGSADGAELRAAVSETARRLEESLG